MDRVNCWKVRKCGREQHGINIKDLGVCPAAIEIQEKRFNGLNNGKFAGRACWLVAGTLCGGEIQGTSAQKRSTCLTCDFYQQVHDEEKNFKIFPV